MKTNKRRGFSLIEMSAVIGVSTVIAGMAVWLLHVSMQKTRHGQNHLAAHNTIARLAETFRRDAHAAVAIGEEQNAADPATCSNWLFTLASGRVVRYTFEAGGLSRAEYASLPANKKDSQKAFSRDVFVLPPGVVVSMQLHPPSQPRMASLLVSSPPADARPRMYPLRIDAAVSSDGRFETIVSKTNNEPASSEDTGDTGK